ncbi:MAG TPA: hypothetical protein VJR71_15460 [Pseudolabrys sp.]|nr:hypothetical protein [Pseudolabrys sp.]
MQRRWHIAGFTLVEALVATILMGLILTALATVTAQWLPNWNRGFSRVQRTEQVAVAVERLVADLASAEFVIPNRKTNRPLFEGNELSVSFVRSSIGPNSRSGLDLIQIGETAGQQGQALVRSSTAFIPGLDSIAHFRNPVVLLRSPYRVTFSYAGANGVWKDTWHDEPGLPKTVRLTIRDASTARVLPFSTVAAIRAELPAQCANSDDCDEIASDEVKDAPSRASGGE